MFYLLVFVAIYENIVMINTYILEKIIHKYKTIYDCSNILNWYNSTGL